MNNPLKPSALKQEETPEVKTARYSSHPIENYSVGNYVFEKGLLTLTGDEIAVFDKLLETLPPQESNRIKKLDVEAADRIVREMLANQKAAATQVNDSSIGERATPVIGKGKLEDSNPPAGE